MKWAALLLCACQPAVLAPVVPSVPGSRIVGAHTEPPAVMVLLDKSGSMSAPLAGGSGCNGCTFPTCPEATCPTRMGAVRQWSTSLLDRLGQTARWGLTAYPHDNVCTGPQPNDVLVPIPSTVGAGEVDAQLHAAMPGGGTPTAYALAFAGGFQGGNAERMVLLLTDGLPNCNATALNDCTVPTACRCTLNGGNCGTTVNDSDPNNFCRRGCLDEDATVNAVKSLTAFGVFTFVVGFGSDFQSADARGVLDAMSKAATDGVRCASDADCFGAFTCGPTGFCAGPAAVAHNAVELLNVTDALRLKIALSAKCRFTLDGDVTSAGLHVYAGTVEVPAADLVIEAPRRVRLLGASCTAAQAADAATLTFRVER